MTVLTVPKTLTNQLSLAIPLWVGTRVLMIVMTTTTEENGKFCVAVAPATRTAGILTQLVKGAGCYIEPAIQPIWVIYWLNGFNPRRLKALKGG